MNTETPVTTTVQSIGEIVRKAESDHVSGNTQISKYVSFRMWDTLNRIDAYINSKHITGDKDSSGREKPFFNIVTAAINVWYRATDIDRSNIRIRATKAKDWIDSFLATVHVQDWMRRARFGQFLNAWGRTLARYGSAVVKFVENNDGLFISVIPWSLLIVDQVDFHSNPKIEVIELTEAQLKQRVQTNGYKADAVDQLCAAALVARQNLDRRQKDNKSGYIKLYEVHGKLPLSHLTGTPADEGVFVQQMHVISFVGTRNGRKTDYQDFTLYAGREAKDPYVITHLIPEEGRTLAIGAVENLFDPQWMMNHNMKNIKDQLDLASRIILQTSDMNFVGRNVLSDLEQGEIFTHAEGKPVTQLNNTSHDIVSSQNFAIMWKGLGNEINGISEAMLGAAPKSGTAWRQTEALLQESYSLFEIMTENKGLAIEDMMREFVIPYIKRTKMDTADEIAATLQDHDVNRIDGIYLKGETTKRVNRRLVRDLIDGKVPTPESVKTMTAEERTSLAETFSSLGNQRFFKPSDVSERTWAEQFKDLEWEVEIDVTGEQKNTQEALTTLSTALKLVLTPEFEQSPRAQSIVGRILELTGAMSPLEYSSIPKPQPQPVQPPSAPPAKPPTLPVGGEQII